MFCEIIYGHAEATREERKPTIRMSGIGHCGRRIAYEHHGFTGTPPDGKAVMIFEDGDFAHKQLRAKLRDGLLAQKSCYSLVDQEAELLYDWIVGHHDGYLKHDQACHHKDHRDRLLEVKSMGSYAFEKFKRYGEIGREYLAQVSIYMAANKLDEAVVIAKNKDNADLHEAIIPIDHELLEERLELIKRIRKSAAPEDIRREYGPDKAGNLPWQCGYCPYVMGCWAASQPKIVSRNKIRLQKVSLEDIL